MRRIKELVRKLDYLSPEQVDQIQAAYDLAEAAHKHQKRSSGEPYITHPLAVASHLASMRMDAQTLMAALLHDVIEDTFVDKQQISDQFGPKVAELVDGLSKMNQIEFKSRLEAQAENFRKMLLAMSQDIRVIIVKLADRLHNMRTLASLSLEKKRRIARETLDIFAPIAYRLGMHEIASELENLGFQALYPQRYRILETAVREVRGAQKQIISHILETFEHRFQQTNIEDHQITGREKNLYSIYKKMRRKRLSFKQVMDVYGFRIVTDTVDNCYRILGLVHSIYKPIPERFKDYIAISKNNGYQSLHTTLFGPQGIPIEIQIRTHEMEQIANSGIASHWHYKWDEKASTHAQADAENWLRNLIEMQQKSRDSLEFLEDVKMELFPDKVYVFTPKGRIIQLPANATPIDFAYMVHTDVGKHCVAAKIDRQLAPLSMPLTSGQTVEIITSKDASPNPSWLDFVVSAKARSAIRHYLKSRQRDEAIALGNRMLEQGLQQYQSSLKKISDSQLQTLLNALHYTTREDLFADIGLGNRLSLMVANQLLQLPEKTSPFHHSKPLLILGSEGLVVAFATCCYPIPGDSIMGLIEKGKGIEVHVSDCEKGLRKSGNFQRIEVSWAEKINVYFTALLKVEGLNQTGILGNIAQIVATQRADILDIKITYSSHEHFSTELKLRVQDRPHLLKVARALKQLKAITRVYRKSSKD